MSKNTSVSLFARMSHGKFTHSLMIPPDGIESSENFAIEFLSISDGITEPSVNGAKPCRNLNPGELKSVKMTSLLCIYMKEKMWKRFFPPKHTFLLFYFFSSCLFLYLLTLEGQVLSQASPIRIFASNMVRDLPPEHHHDIPYLLLLFSSVQVGLAELPMEIRQSQRWE